MSTKLPDKWTTQDRKFFRGVRDEIILLDSLILHLRTAAMTKAEMKTIAHNTAWVAVEEKRRNEGRQP